MTSQSVTDQRIVCIVDAARKLVPWEQSKRGNPMTRLERIKKLNQMLLADLPQYCHDAGKFQDDEINQRRLLRSLMNVRPPMPLNQEFLILQDDLLSAESKEKGIVTIGELPGTAVPGVYLWQGDITRLMVDAIVNAANSALLGCFCPCHGCIDNGIHSAAGLQLRDECSQLMQAQGRQEATGQAKITGAYNLPSRYVLHTVGPIVHGPLKEEDCEALQSCYRSCLTLAEEKNLKSIAFCCISTGEFHFPNQEAAEIAVAAVKEFLDQKGSGMEVIFNVFKDLDYKIYHELLGTA